jgi:hypothetical protein
MTKLETATSFAPLTPLNGPWLNLAFRVGLTLGARNYESTSRPFRPARSRSLLAAPLGFFVPSTRIEPAHRPRFNRPLAPAGPLDLHSFVEQHEVRFG